MSAHVAVTPADAQRALEATWRGGWDSRRNLIAACWAVCGVLRRLDHYAPAPETRRQLIAGAVCLLSYDGDGAA